MVDRLTFVLFVCGLCLAECYIPRFFRGRPKGGMVGAPRGQRMYSSEELPTDMWVTQKLDHFNGADTRTWSQVKSHYCISKSSLSSSPLLN